MRKTFAKQYLPLLLLVVSFAQAQQNAKLKLGNPSGATTDAASKDNYLLIKKQYTLSYNSSRGSAKLGELDFESIGHWNGQTPE
jgi:endonuclease G, mitochondrial